MMNFARNFKWHPNFKGNHLLGNVHEFLHVDVVIGNEEDAADVLDIHPADTDVTSGHLNVNAYQDVAQQIVAGAIE